MKKPRTEDIKLIELKVRKQFGKVKNFCEFTGQETKTWTSKLRTIDNKISSLKSFLKPLGLTINVVELDEKK